MYVVELKNGDWICSESKKRIEEITGKAGSKESLDKIKNLWYQPFNYLSGVMSDFFLVIKEGVRLNEEIPMRGWNEVLPLTQCISGKVKFLGKKEPKWYSEIINNGN